MFLNDSVIDAIHKALDAASFRQNLIASNIANADTPGYKAKHIPFKDVLMLQNNDIRLKTTDKRHIKTQEDFSYLIKPDNNDYLVKNDKNNVKLDTEMTLLAKNTILVNALTAFEKYKFNQYKDIISASRNM